MMYSNTVTSIKHLGNLFYGRKYHSKQEYFRSSNLIPSSKRLNDILNPNLSNHLYLTSNEEFKPMGLSFHSNIKTCTKSLEAPHFILHNPNIKNHDVLFFKKMIGDVKMNIQLHFLNDKLFFIHNEIRHHLLHTYTKNEEFLRLMLERYHTNSLKEYDNRDLVLRDSFGNNIFTSNQVCFGISYLSNSPIFKQEAESLTTSKEKLSSLKKESRLQLILAHI